MSGQQQGGIGRRSFLSRAAVAAAAAPLVGASVSGAAPAAPSGKLRLALVGTGSRGTSLWGKTLVDKYSDVLEFVALCDINTKRMAFARQYMGVSCPTYRDIEFDRMIAETRPDAVIVTTRDCFHAKYIVRAMELGCDVITEKPLSTDEGMCQQVIDTERRTGRKLTVTFNYRYSPEAEKIREIIASGELGQLTSVDFNYYLDTSHGADYFRRWHGFKQNSGSLWVHKATHHFDLLNWWLAAEPQEVWAQGQLRRYGFNGQQRGESCRSCAHKQQCEFYWDITRDDLLMKLYVEPESEDGYIRDSCVFREQINIWDTMAATVRYHNDVMLSYSLNCFMPYEGYQAAFNGTKGRLDVRVYHAQPWQVGKLADFRVTKLFGDTRTFEIGAGGGGHWGSDDKMQNMIFRGAPDPMHQMSGSRGGALSILIGIAARRSIEQQRPVKIEELVRI